MNWLNLNVATLDSAEFLGAEPTERATWLLLLRYCCGQENGGRIRDCKDWKSRKWEQICRVTIEEVSAVCELWEWDGSDLVVWAYPDEKEEQVKAGRHGGKKGGRPGKNPPENPQVNPPENPQVNPPENPQVNPPENPHQNPKGREGKGKEDKGREQGEGADAPTPPAPDFSDFRNGQDLARSHDWVAGLFRSPCLSAAELEAMKANARAFLSLSDDDRRMVDAFQRVPRSKLDQGAAWHRPDKCLFWIRDFPEVLRSAKRWVGQEKPTAPKREAPPMPADFPAWLRDIGHPAAPSPKTEWANPAARAAYAEAMANA